MRSTNHSNDKWTQETGSAKTYILISLLFLPYFTIAFENLLDVAGTTIIAKIAQEQSWHFFSLKKFKKYLQLQKVQALS